MKQSEKWQTLLTRPIPVCRTSGRDDCTQLWNGYDETLDCNLVMWHEGILPLLHDEFMAHLSIDDKDILQGGRWKFAGVFHGQCWVVCN